MPIDIIPRASTDERSLVRREIRTSKHLIFVARPKITDAADNPFRLPRASRIRDSSEPSVPVREHTGERARTQKTRRRRGGKTGIA